MNKNAIAFSLILSPAKSDFILYTKLMSVKYSQSQTLVDHNDFITKFNFENTFSPNSVLD